MHAQKKGDWWADIHADEPTLHADGTVAEFKTYSAWNKIKSPSITIGPAKFKSQKNYVGMYLAEDLPDDFYKKILKDVYGIE